MNSGCRRRRLPRRAVVAFFASTEEKSKHTHPAYCGHWPAEAEGAPIFPSLPIFFLPARIFALLTGQKFSPLSRAALFFRASFGQSHFPSPPRTPRDIRRKYSTRIKQDPNRRPFQKNRFLRIGRNFTIPQPPRRGAHLILAFLFTRLLAC